MPACWRWGPCRAIRPSSSTKFTPPTGTEVAIEVRWKDKDGKVQHAKAQDWIRNVTTKKPLDANWVFVGSATADEPGDRQGTSTWPTAATSSPC